MNPTAQVRRRGGEGLPGDWFLKLRRPEPSGEVKGDR